MSTETNAPKKTLTKATQMLFHVAKHSHSLRQFMGIRLIRDEEKDRRMWKIEFDNIQRPWLVPDYPGASELSFDPDKWVKSIGCLSTHEHNMCLWLVNIWNTSYAKEKGWHFDFFSAAGGLDEGNRKCIILWMESPIWP